MAMDSPNAPAATFTARGDPREHRGPASVARCGSMTASAFKRLAIPGRHQCQRGPSDDGMCCSVMPSATVE
jgi:hypothetical protein